MTLIEKYWKPALLYAGVPLAVLWFLFMIGDNLIMPILTRHSEEFPLASVIGRSEIEAQQILKKNDLTLQVAGREYFAGKPEGIVLSQLPSAGMMVKSGRSIKVVVSAGVRTAKVPDVSGLPLEEANLTLQKAGFVVGETYWMRMDTLPENVAIETIPTKGTVLPLGSKVSLAVNQLTPSGTVFMPQLVGLPLDRARAMLESLNLGITKIDHVRDTLYLPNTVLDQVPLRNAPLTPGDSVRLTVSETD
jgi:serine/threonine-protein kinase